MKIFPEKEEIRKIAETGRYDIAPVRMEILSDICTPIQALAILKKISHHAFILESAAEKEKWGRYTFLGYDPVMEITCEKDSMKVGDREINKILTISWSQHSVYAHQGLFLFGMSFITSLNIFTSSIILKSNIPRQTKSPPPSKP